MVEKFSKPSIDDNSPIVSIYTLKALGALGFVLKGTAFEKGMPHGNARLVVKQRGSRLGSCTSAAIVVDSLESRFPELAKQAKGCWKVAYSIIYTEESEVFEEGYDLKDGGIFADQLFKRIIARRKQEGRTEYSVIRRQNVATGIFEL
jgi:hypothetical protein